MRIFLYAAKEALWLWQFGFNWWLKISSLSLSLPIHNSTQQEPFNCIFLIIATSSNLPKAWAIGPVSALPSLVSNPSLLPENFNNARGYKYSIYHFTAKCLEGDQLQNPILKSDSRTISNTNHPQLHFPGNQLLGRYLCTRGLLESVWENTPGWELQK